MILPAELDPFGSIGSSGPPEARPVLGRDQTGVLLTESVGIPVHAVLAPGRRLATRAVLKVLRDAPHSTVLITFANPATVLQARRSAAFGQDLTAFDLVLPDGIGMCLAIKWLHGLPARRVSFDMTSLGPAVFEHAREAGLDVVLVGSAPGVAARARDRILRHYPGLQVTGVLDGLGDVSATIRQVIALRPRIIFRPA